MAWPCFLIEPIGNATEYVVGHGAAGSQAAHRCVIAKLGGVEFHDAPDGPAGGWPDTCPECGTPLRYDPDDREQGWRTRVGLTVYRRPDNGEEHTNVHEFGIGAMFDADWLPWKGPDGLSLSVVLPPGGISDVWHIDGPAGGSDRRPWSRSGTPPIVTASPSILTDRYHGFLQLGVLTDSLPDRPAKAA